MHDLTYSEMKTLETMLDVYLIHCTSMADRWRQAADYHKTFLLWEGKKQKAKQIVSYLLEGEHPVEEVDGFGIGDDGHNDEEVHGDDPR